MVILHDSLTCAINGNMLVVVTPLSLTDDWTSSLLVVAVIAKNRSDTHIRYTNADHLHWRCQSHGSANGRLVHNQWYWWPHAGLQTHIYRCTQNTLLLLASTYQCFYANNTTMYTMSKSSLKWSWQYLQCRDFYQNFLPAQVQRAAKVIKYSHLASPMKFRTWLLPPRGITGQLRSSLWRWSHQAD